MRRAWPRCGKFLLAALIYLTILFSTVAGKPRSGATGKWRAKAPHEAPLEGQTASPQYESTFIGAPQEQVAEAPPEQAAEAPQDAVVGAPQAAGFPPIQTLINAAPSRIDPVYRHRRTPQPTEADAFRLVRSTIDGWFNAAQAQYAKDSIESTNDELGRIIAGGLKALFTSTKFTVFVWDQSLTDMWNYQLYISDEDFKTACTGNELGPDCYTTSGALDALFPVKYADKQKRYAVFWVPSGDAASVPGGVDSYEVRPRFHQFVEDCTQGQAGYENSEGFGNFRRYPPRVLNCMLWKMDGHVKQALRVLFVAHADTAEGYSGGWYTYAASEPFRPLPEASGDGIPLVYAVGMFDF